MAIWIYIFILSTTASILSIKYCKPTIRSYIIDKDFFVGYKAGEYSIYDSTNKTLQYRIESNFAFGHKFKVINRFNKQMIAKLRSRTKQTSYCADFSILDLSSNQWINGTIEKTLNKTVGYYRIKWNEENIFIRFKSDIKATTFEHEYNNTILATVKRQTSRLFAFLMRYDLQILSNQLPDSIYFLASAVKDDNNTPRGRG